jgi:crotonobetainyl-CoA:carnitine CoA-transferase CaiB-like acyl-CoA transferase
MRHVASTTNVLAGIRVADFSRVLAGPYASMMLADFGGDVIKIESPVGDETRAWSPPLGADGQSAYFGSVNRNKRSVVCDLSTEAGLAHARELAMTADVILENFRPARSPASGRPMRVLNWRVTTCSCRPSAA